MSNRCPNAWDFSNTDKNLITIFGKDRDANGEFDNKHELRYIYRFDFEKEELIPVIDSVKMNEIQKNLDGKKLVKI